MDLSTSCAPGPGLKGAVQSPNWLHLPSQTGWKAAGIPTQTGDYLDPVEGPATVLVSEKMPCQHRQSLALDEEIANGTSLEDLLINLETA